MNSAQKVIEKFGGQTALARLLEKRQSMVQHWAKTGIIPAKWHGPLLKIAMIKDVDLQPIEFIGISSAEIVEEVGALSAGKGRNIAKTGQRIRQGKAKQMKGSVMPSDQDTDMSFDIATLEVMPEEALPENLPVAKHKGFLNLMDIEIPCYVLDNGQRVIGRTAATEMLTGIKGGGGLEKYLRVSPLKPFVNLENVLERMVSFRLPEVEGLDRHVKGLPADLVIEVCRGFVSALDASTRDNSRYASLTPRQTEMAV
jgi:hypothetical protein